MRILFIDDEPIRLQLVPKQHRSDIYVAHGMDQISYYLTHSGLDFDLICCDHDMPALDGTQVCNMFLLDRSIPVVVHSANTAGAPQRMLSILEDACTPAILLPITAPHWWRKVGEFYTRMTGKRV